MKSLIFLYPIPEYFEADIRNSSYYLKVPSLERKYIGMLDSAKTEDEIQAIGEQLLKEKGDAFKETYKEKLNECIDLRYRKNGFSINYAVFGGHDVSDVVSLAKGDNVIEVGMDFSTHTSKMPDGSYPYPDSDYIIGQLGETKVVRVCGFHMWDCVDRLAKRTYELGFDTLVDEDLTEFFGHRIKDEDFRTDRYPTFNPRKFGYDGFREFIAARESRPWLWQDY